MKGELKDKVARGVAWSMAEKTGSMLLQIAVSLVILRLLSPGILGITAIPISILIIALVIVDGGFSQSLIRKADPSEDDYKSVFAFNMTVALVLYVLFVSLGPVLAWYYQMPEIAAISPVIFLQLPLGALCTIQNTIFVRQFRFDLLSKVTLAATLVSGFAAIGLAVAGCGIWAVVWQRVLMMSMRAAMLWWLSAWRPRGCFRWASLREMAPFSLSLLATDLISNLYNKIPQFFFGRLYSDAVLGSFDQAVKLKDQPSTSLMQAVQSVTFPAMTKIKDDAVKFAESYRQVMMVVAYIMFPMMLGMSAVSYDMMEVLLGEKWMQTAPYLEVVSLTGLFYPISMVAYNVLKTMSDGSIIVKLEIFKKVIMTIIFAVTIPISVEAVTWGLVAIAFSEMVVNFAATMRFCPLTLWRFVRTLAPVALAATGMYAAVRLAGFAVTDSALLRLLAEIGVGVVSYALFSALFRLEAFREIIAIIKKQVAR